MNVRELDINKIKLEKLDIPDDVDLAGDLLSREHYLGNCKLQGEQMRYVATYRGKWVAILYFHHATRHSADRDKLIGWDLGLRVKRRKYISGNARYLVLKEFTGIRNLGSKILSLVAERISNDWEKKYGHPILALETYVDPDAGYEGSCYRGAGWEELGLTKGFVLPEGIRTSPKYYFIKSLHKESYAALGGEFDHPLITGTRPLQGSSNNFVLDPNKLDFPRLREALSEVEDPRSKMGRRYELLPILTLSVAAVLSGHTQYRQISDWIAALPSEVRAKAKMRGDRVPSESMLGKLFRRLDAKQLECVISRYLLKYHKNISEKVLSLDGKHVRATAPNASDHHRFLNVIVQDLGITIKQLHIAPQSDERAEAALAIEELDLDGVTITADAIHTCSTAARAIVKKKGRFSSVSKTITNC